LWPEASSSTEDEAEALKAIDSTPVRFGGTWDELRKETREL